MKRNGPLPPDDEAALDSGRFFVFKALNIIILRHLGTTVDLWRRIIMVAAVTTFQISLKVTSVQRNKTRERDKYVRQ
jgi:hypothetical protein